MKDYYNILGVDRSATDAEIKQAFRRLASRHHPDKGGDTRQFQEIQEAYEVLSDVAKRREYDNPRPAMNFNTGDFGFHDIFSMFGAGPGSVHVRQNMRMQLWISLKDVALGGPRTVSVSGNQKPIEIDIPRGIEDGVTMRYPQLAQTGGDLLITFRIRPEPGWSRQDQNVTLDRSVLIWDLILGSTITVETLAGNQIDVTIPANTQPNGLLRIRGHGLLDRRTNQAGDMFIRLLARLPDSISPELHNLLLQENSNKY